MAVTANLTCLSVISSDKRLRLNQGPKETNLPHKKRRGKLFLPSVIFSLVNGDKLIIQQMVTIIENNMMGSFYFGFIYLDKGSTWIMINDFYVFE